MRTCDITFMTISEGMWYIISTAIDATGYTLSVDGKEVAFVIRDEDQPYVGWGSAAVTNGTFGFGPFLTQVAYFKDVRVTAPNGIVIYDEPLTSEDILEGYAIVINGCSVCLDGAKRDREVCVSDFVNTARIIAARGGRFDHVRSVIEFEFDSQYPPGPAHGFVPIQAYPGAEKQYREAYYPSGFNETDCQFFFLLVLGDYVPLTTGTDFLGK